MLINGPLCPDVGRICCRMAVKAVQNKYTCYWFGGMTGAHLHSLLCWRFMMFSSWRSRILLLSYFWFRMNTQLLNAGGGCWGGSGSGVWAVQLLWCRITRERKTLRSPPEPPPVTKPSQPEHKRRKMWESEGLKGSQNSSQNEKCTYKCIFLDRWAVWMSACCQSINLYLYCTFCTNEKN